MGPTRPDTAIARAAVIDRLVAAQRLVQTDRAQALAALEALFATGTLPETPLAGRYAGAVVALMDLPLWRWLGTPRAARLRACWQGKTFDPTRWRADNMVARAALPLLHLLWPWYRGSIDDGPERVRVFPLRTSVAPGKTNPRQVVLRGDYDLPGNPRLSIRRSLDEMVQVGEELYLGKGYFRWWTGQWQVTLYFVLSREPIQELRTPLVV